MTRGDRGLAEGQELDRFVVVRELGRGAMGRVYLVRHRVLGSLHALKWFEAGDPAMLLKEGRLQAALRHPNIVAVADMIEIPEGDPSATVDADAPRRQALVMEYVEGPSLSSWLAGQRPDPDRAVRLFLGILAGVEHAHAQGIVHRDLKPGNILLQALGNEFVPKVADFGLAKALDGSGGAARTQAGQLKGTPAYMSPEQVRDSRSVDSRSDLFSLGCILYEMATGTRAFPGDDVVYVLGAILQGSYVPPRRIMPDLPSGIDQAIRACLSPDREERPPDCATVRAIIERRQPWGEAARATPIIADTLVERQVPEVPATLVQEGTTDGRRPGMGRGPWKLLLLAGIVASALVAIHLRGTGGHDVPSFSPLPLTVLLYDLERGAGQTIPEWGDPGAQRRFLGEGLIPALLEGGAKAVILDFTFENDLGDDSRPLLDALEDAHRHAIPVMAVAPLVRPSAIPVCLSPGACLDGLLDGRPPLVAAETPGEPAFTAWPWCVGSRPSMGLGTAGLLGSPSTGCRGDLVPLFLPPADRPCDWPYQVMMVSELLKGVPASGPDPRTGEGRSICPTWSSDLAGRVVLVGDPWLSDGRQDAVVLEDPSGRRQRYTGVEVHAVVAANMLIRSMPAEVEASHPRRSLGQEGSLSIPIRDRLPLEPQP